MTYTGLCIGGPHDGTEQECRGDMFKVLLMEKMSDRYQYNDCAEPVRYNEGYYQYEWLAIKQPEYAEPVEFGLWRWHELSNVEMWQRILKRYADLQPSQ